MRGLRTLLFISLALLVGICKAQELQPWEALSCGTNLNLAGVDFINPDTGIVVGAQGLILRTTDGGDNWETLDGGVTIDLNGVQFISESRVMAVGNSGKVIRSDDMGGSWELVPLGSGITLGGISVDRISGNGLISGATLAMIWTSDFGSTWVLGMGGYLSDFYKAHMTPGNFGAAFGVNSIMQPLIGYTDDFGSSFDMWNFYPFVGGVNYEGSAVDGYFFSKNEGFVVGRVWNGQGFITSDIDWTSHAWDAQFVPLPLAAIHFGGTDHGVTVGGSNTAFVFLETLNGGATWETPVVNGNETGFNDVILVGETGYAVGNGGQIVKRFIPDPTAIPPSDNVVRWSLSPNPAKRLAVATVVTNEPQKIGLRLTELTGRTLITIPGKEVSAGRHLLQIDLTGLKPGNYFVYLDRGTLSGGVKKLLVIGD